MSSSKIYIKSSRDFRRTIKEGRIYKSPHFVFHSIFKKPVAAVTESSSSNLFKAESAKLGISISRASVLLASRRNRIKRVIRELWRKRKTEAKPAKEIVIIVKKGTERLKNEQITAEINGVLDKILS